MHFSYLRFLKTSFARASFEWNAKQVGIVRAKVKMRRKSWGSLASILSYLVGSIPTGLVLGKLIWHVDLREYGSHNIEPRPAHAGQGLG